MLEIIKTLANCFLSLGSANIMCRLRINLQILLLLCKAVSLEHNKDSRICPQNLILLALPLRWATFQQAYIWSLVSPFGGLESCKKGHYVGDCSITTVPCLSWPWLAPNAPTASNLFSVCSHLLFIAITISFGLLREYYWTACCYVSCLIHTAHSGKFIWIILSSGLVEAH